MKASVSAAPQRIPKRLPAHIRATLDALPPQARKHMVQDLLALMLLNLRHVSNTHTGGGLSEKTIPELAFAQNSIIGNLGAPLINDPDEFIEERTDIIEFAASSDLDIARDA